MAFTGRGINTIRTTGDQAKSGRIDFQNNYDLIWNTTPAAGNKQVSMVFGNTIDAAGSTLTNLATRKVVNGRELYAVLQTFITASGVIGTLCPGSDLNNSIVTTLTHGDNFIYLGNKLKIMWGNCSSADQIVLLPYPFDTTNYQVVVTNGAGESSQYCPVVADLTTTSFHKSDRGQHWIACGY